MRTHVEGQRGICIFRNCLELLNFLEQQKPICCCQLQWKPSSCPPSGLVSQIQRQTGSTSEMWAWCEPRFPLCPHGICGVDGAGFIVLLTLLLYLIRGRRPGLVTPLEGICGRRAASPLPSMFERPSTVSVVIICCIMIKTETGGRGCAISLRVSLLREMSLEGREPGWSGAAGA